MKAQIKTIALALTVALTAGVALPLVAAPGEAKVPAADYFRSSPMLGNPEKAPIYAATLAGKRVVAVGDYGMVIVSDDGKAFRQAKVPSRSPLTGVFFLDAKLGWAVGHDGTVLNSIDGGDTWQVQREKRGQDQVLMSVWFENAEHGLAIGQFGLAVETLDGGKSWQERSLVEGEAGERHLMQLVAAGNGLLLVAAEAGTILRSEDAGKTWQAIQTDNKGSFWTGAALADGSLLMAGMRGHVYRSEDRGVNWKEIPSGTQQSFTGIVQRPDDSVHVVGLAGASLLSQDGGKSFKSLPRPDRMAMTSVVSGPAGELAFTALGMVLRQ